MGVVENAVFLQLKKAQGETNERLDLLLAETQNTNRWLARLAKLLEEREPATASS